MSDNFYGKSCPAPMMDDRLFSNYKTDRDATTQFMRDNNINSSEQVRMILQRHGDQIRNKISSEYATIKCNGKTYVVSNLNNDGVLYQYIQVPF